MKSQYNAKKEVQQRFTFPRTSLNFREVYPLKKISVKVPVLPHFLPFSDGNSDGLLYENRKFIHIAGLQFKRRMHITVEGNINTGVS